MGESNRPGRILALLLRSWQVTSSLVACFLIYTLGAIIPTMQVFLWITGITRLL